MHHDHLNNTVPTRRAGRCGRPWALACASRPTRDAGTESHAKLLIEPHSYCKLVGLTLAGGLELLHTLLVLIALLAQSFIARKIYITQRNCNLDGLELAGGLELLHALLVLLELLTQVQELVPPLVALLEAVEVHLRALLLLRGLTQRRRLGQRHAPDGSVAMPPLQVQPRSLNL